MRSPLAGPRRLVRWMSFTLVVPALLLAACGGGSADGDDETYNVLAVMPITGALAQQAVLETNGLKAAAKELNENGGVNGKDVKIKVVDDKLDPTEAVSLVQEELNGSTPPDLVVAGVSSNEALAVLPALTRAKVLSTSGAAIEDLTDASEFPYHYVVVPTATQNYERMIDYLNEQDVKTLGMAVTNDALGTSALDSMKELASENGITLYAESFDPTSTDLTSTLSKIQASDPDMLLLSAYGPPAGYLLEARQKLGWDVPTIGDPSIASSNPATLVDSASIADVRVQALSVLSKGSDQRPGAAEAIELIKAEGDIPQAVHLATTMYDFLHRVASAADDAGSTDADDIKKEMDTEPGPEGVTYESFGYSADDHGITTTDDTFVYIQLTPMVDGQFSGDEE